MLRTPCHVGVDSGVLLQLNLELGGFIGLLLLFQAGAVGWRKGMSHKRFTHYCQCNSPKHSSTPVQSSRSTTYQRLEDYVLVMDTGLHQMHILFSLYT